MRRAFCAVALIALACLLVRAGRLGLAGDYIDSFSHIRGQDEALYAHSAIHMAKQGGWLTPMFMGRYGLYKPPLLAAAAGLSARIFGVSHLALRFPGILIACLAVGLVFWWAAEVHSWQAGACAAALLISNHMWHSLASMCITDGMLAAFYLAALYCLFADPWLESRWALGGFAGAVAASILTKSVAGVFPLAVLGLYWMCGPRKQRPRLARVLLAGGLALALAAPWFLYQLAVHGRWFVAEHIGVEILAYGAGTPPQTSNENQALFYLKRAALLDPLLLAAVAFALPMFLREVRRRSASAILLALMLAVPALAVLTWRYRNVSYLLPLIPALAILAAAYNPLCRGRAARWMMALVAVAFVAKAAVPSAVWGLSFSGGTNVEAAPLLSDYCQRARGNELIVVEAPDELYASVLPLSKLRYVFAGEVPPPSEFGMDFVGMGIVLNAAQFAALPQAMPAFRQRLHEWGVDSTAAVGSVIFVSKPAEVAAMIAEHPDSDFFLSARYRGVATHDLVRVSPDYILLLSRHVLPPPAVRWSCRL